MRFKRWFIGGCAGALLAACRDTTAPEREPATSNVVARDSATALPVSNTWSTKARMYGARSEASAAAINGIIYVVGGHAPTRYATPTLQAYNVVTNTWTNRKSMPDSNIDMYGASAINGRLYVSGSSFSGVCNRLYVYTPETNTWARKANIPVCEQGGGVQGVINGRLYVAFGHLYSWHFFYRYEPSTNSWTKLPAAPSAHDQGVGGVIDGKFYLAGGEEDYATHGWLEVYNPSTNSWNPEAEMPVWRTRAASAVINGKLYVAGGYDWHWPRLEYYLLVYDPATNTWALKAPPLTPRHDAAGAAAGGKFFVMGGVNPLETQIFPTVEAYTP